MTLLVLGFFLHPNRTQLLCCDRDGFHRREDKCSRKEILNKGLAFPSVLATSHGCQRWVRKPSVQVVEECFAKG